ncbi:MAG: Pilus assembly protein [Deltaproteobacteria bacterium]|nr:Pilus assembly protein [Deltaproteobacteria bacterium]
MNVTHNTNGRKDKGQSFVEIALITPILLGALMVAVDFGIAFYMGNLIAVAARDGARIGSQLEKTGGNAIDADFAVADAATISNKVQNRIPRYLTGRQIIVTFYEDDAGVGPPPCSESVEVQVSGNYSFTLYRLMNFLGANVPASRTLTRSTRMRYNYQRYEQNVTCILSSNVNSSTATYDIPNG